MAELEQWVNIDPAEARFHTIPGEKNLKKARCGKRLRLCAKTSGKGKKKGRKVWWAIQPGDDNIVKRKAGDEPAGWKWQAGQGGFSAPGFFEKCQPTNKKGESRVHFDVSSFGGDAFEVKAYKKDKKGKITKELVSDKYVVWRQLFYQVTRMKALPGKVNLPAIPDIPWADLQKEFGDSRKPLNIRWSSVPPSQAMITRHRSLYTLDMCRDTGKEGYDPKMEPLVLKVSMIDMLHKQVIQEDHDFGVLEGKSTYTMNLNKVLFDENSVDDRDDWYVSHDAHVDGSPGKAISIAKTDFKKTGPAQLQVSVPPLGVCKKAKVKVKAKVFDGWLNGRSWYNGIWAIHNTIQWTTPRTIAPRPNPDKVGTMIHEFGHAIGMVDSASPKHYVKHGHKGNHCWNGATDPSTLASITTEFPSTPRATCVMFGDSSRTKDVFCDVCVPFVRKIDPSSDGKFKAGSMLPK